jgi:hypothetical protein
MVAAQRENLARATSALDRAIDVLMPGEPGEQTGYAANGRPARPAHGASADA